MKNMNNNEKTNIKLLIAFAVLGVVLSSLLCLITFMLIKLTGYFFFLGLLFIGLIIWSTKIVASYLAEHEVKKWEENL